MRPDRTPRRRTYLTRQVSWLADRRGGLAFPAPCGPVTLFDRRSPLTVAGAAPAFHRLPVLASRRTGRREEPRPLQDRRRAYLVNRDIKNSLYRFHITFTHEIVNIDSCENRPHKARRGSDEERCSEGESV